tara:strand:+ start:55408 stop:56178 length:771 start_codon:yes stop_codon:yes gene_type:complete
MILNFKESEIFYTRKGTGKAVVLLHGFLENASMWEPFLDTLKQKHTTIAVDLPGHGKSASIGYVHTMEMMAEAVKEVLLKENILSATFIGHSMGGYVALAFAEKYPQIIEKLVLLNSTSKKDSLERKNNRDRAIELVKQNKKGFLSMAISNLFAEKNRERFKQEITQLKKEALTMPVQGIIATLEGMKIRKDHTLTLAEFSKPKYIISGIQDPIMPYKEQEKLAKKCGCTFISLDGGHMSTIENKDETLNFVHFIE